MQAAPAGSAGARAGLRAGDRLWRWTASRSPTAREFSIAVSAARPGGKLSVDVERAGARLPIDRRGAGGDSSTAATVGRLGIMLAEKGPRVWPPGLIETRRSGPLAALDVGVQKTWEMSSLTVQMLVAHRDRAGVGEEHLRADQHCRVRRHQRLSRADRVHRLPGHHQREPGRAQFDAGAAARRRSGASINWWRPSRAARCPSARRSSVSRSG